MYGKKKHQKIGTFHTIFFIYKMNGKILKKKIVFIRKTKTLKSFANNRIVFQFDSLKQLKKNEKNFFF